MGYLREEATDLLKYAQNYNRHFISRKCQDVIVEARRLMTSEIHDTVKVRRRQLVCLFVCLCVPSVCVSLKIFSQVIEMPTYLWPIVDLPRLQGVSPGAAPASRGQEEAGRPKG